MTPRKRTAAPGRKIRVLVVDDHPIVRQGLTQLIASERDMTVSGQAEDAVQALAAIKASVPDIALVDISLHGTSGIDLIQAIKANHPGVSVLVVSMHDESLYAERALRVGAMGYVMKREPPEKVVEGIRRVMSGEVYLSDRMAAAIVKKSVGGRSGAEASPLERLSNRELQVFQLLGRGLGTRQAAEHLHLSAKTVETYRASIKKKLKLKNAAQLVAHAVGWVQGLKAE